MSGHKYKNKLIGLTGGAGSGKSTVAKVFQRHGACVIDADSLGHGLLKGKSSCFAKVIKTFGPDILSAKKTIDRDRLGDLVFSDPAKMRRLNRIVHPVLLEEIRKRIKTCRVKYPGRPVVIDAALIMQWGLDKKLDLLVMVDSHKKLRLSRMQARGISRNKALRIMTSQMPVRRIREKAGLIISNNGTIGQLKKSAARACKDILRQNIR